MEPNGLTAVAGGESDGEECLDFDRHDKRYVLGTHTLENAFALVVASRWKIAE